MLWTCSNFTVLNCKMSWFFRGICPVANHYLHDVGHDSPVLSIGQVSRLSATACVSDRIPVWPCSFLICAFSAYFPSFKKVGLWDHHAFCVCVSPFIFWTNLVWTLCHYRTPQSHNMIFPTVSNSNKAYARIYVMDVTLEPHNVGYWNYVW
jgi:hypothetical protein